MSFKVCKLFSKSCSCFLCLRDGRQICSKLLNWLIHEVWLNMKLGNHHQVLLGFGPIYSLFLSFSHFKKKSADQTFYIIWKADANTHISLSRTGKRPFSCRRNTSVSCFHIQRVSLFFNISLILYKNNYIITYLVTNLANHPTVLVSRVDYCCEPDNSNASIHSCDH